MLKPLSKKNKKGGGRDRSIVGTLRKTMKSFRAPKAAIMNLTSTAKGRKAKKKSMLVVYKEELEDLEESHDPKLEEKMKKFLQAKKAQNARRKEVFDEPLRAGGKEAPTASGKTRSKSKNRFKSIMLRKSTKFSIQSSKSLRTLQSDIDFDSELSGLEKFKKKILDSDLLRDALEASTFFDELDDKEVEFLVEVMKPISLVKSGHDSTDDLASNFFVIQSGTVEVLSGAAKKKNAVQISVGQSWGESNLMLATDNHSVTMVSENVEAFILSKPVYRQVVAFTEARRFQRLKADLKLFSLLASKTNTEIEELSTVVHLVQFKKGATILKKGDMGELFYFIKSGSVLVTDLLAEPTAEKAETSITDVMLGPSDYFGEKSLLDEAPRNATVKALTDVSCIVLDKETFKRYLGSVRETLIQNDHFRVLKSTRLLTDVKDSVVRKLVEAFELRTFARDEVIIQQGVHNDFLYIINKGRVKITIYDSSDRTKHMEVGHLSQGDYFGESSLKSTTLANGEVSADSDLVEVYAVEVRKNLRTIKPFAKTLKRQHTMRKNEAVRLREKKDSKMGARPEKIIKLENLKQIRTLGTGAFGRVKLVDHAATKQTFALKILQKAVVVQYKQQQNVFNEKMVMLQSDHPFILRLYNTFQTKNCLYFLLEYIQGGELFSLLQNQGGNISTNWAKFYASNVISALIYLHKRQVVYRDLKPENLLIDRQGYLRVVDFGFAKRITTKSFTLCGTPEYLPPETIQNTGHNRASDYWALGILVYEMIAGFSPFADLDEFDSENEGGGGQERVFERILKCSFVFVPGFDSNARHFVKSCLRKNPRKRLGMGEVGADEMRQHMWFERRGKNKMEREANTSAWWEKVEQKELKPVWLPMLNSNNDASHFEQFEEDDSEMPYKGSNKYWVKF